MTTVRAFNRQETRRQTVNQAAKHTRQRFDVAIDTEGRRHLVPRPEHAKRFRDVGESFYLWHTTKRRPWVLRAERRAANKRARVARKANQ